MSPTSNTSSSTASRCAETVHYVFVGQVRATITYCGCTSLGLDGRQTVAHDVAAALADVQGLPAPGARWATGGFSPGRSWRIVAASAKRSPCSSTRASTSPASKHSGSPSAAASTSSHSTGVDTVGCGRARRQ